MNGEVTELLTKLSEQCEHMSIHLLHSAVLPYVKKVSESREMPPEPLMRIVHHYLVRLVGTEPQYPANWSQSHRGCGAYADCIVLDQFLVSPAENVQRFTKLEKQRKHIEH